MKRAIVVILCIFAFLGTGVGLSLLRQSQRSQAAEKAILAPPPAVTVLRLEKRTVPIRESFYGLVEPWEKVNLSLTTGGQVDVIGKYREGTREYEYKIEEESRVRKGQQILRLEDSKERARLASTEALVEQAEASVLSAKSEIRRMEAGIEAARGRVAEAEAQQQYAIDEFDRISRLLADDRASTNEMDRVRTDKQGADARMRIAQASLQEALVNLETARAQLATAHAKLNESKATRDSALVDLAKTVLLAPIDGVISKLPTEIGEVVKATQTVAVLMNVARVKLAVGVVERKISDLTLGSDVDVYVDSLARSRDAKPEDTKVRGTVTRVSVAADEQTGLFTVEIALDNRDGRLRPGMVGHADVVVAEVNAYPIPVEAMIIRNGAWSAFFLDQTEGEFVNVVHVAIPDGPETEEFRLVTDLPENRLDLVYEGHRRLEDGDEVVIAGHTTYEKRWNYVERLEEQRKALQASLTSR